MSEHEQPTIETSLEMLSDALGRASEDLRAAQVSLDQARTDIASRNTSVSRQVVKDADRVMTHLKQTDECLQDVLKDLAERD